MGVVRKEGCGGASRPPHPSFRLVSLFHGEGGKKGMSICVGYSSTLRKPYDVDKLSKEREKKERKFVLFQNDA
jgi:hypothetical protein